MYECIVLCCLFDCRFGKITEWGPGGETVEVQESVNFQFLMRLFQVSLYTDILEGVPIRILKLFVGKFTYWLTLRRLRGVPVLILYLTKQEIENTEEIENTVVKVGPSFPWNYWLLFSEQKYHLRCHLKSPH